MLKNNTKLVIGPCVFTHQVQKIAVQERKAVDVLDTARSGINFIIDSGESDHRAQIRLLFTGLEEINVGINTLRGLIALFKCCPITTLKNSFLTDSWKKNEDLYNKQTYERIVSVLETADRLNKNIVETFVRFNGETLSARPSPLSINDSYLDVFDLTASVSEVVNKSKFNAQILNQLDTYVSSSKESISRLVVNNITKQLTDPTLADLISPISTLKYRRVYSDFVPVALESIELENVPDMPFSIQATLTIARIDVSAYSETDSLYYKMAGSPLQATENPEDAYWLKLWMGRMMGSGIIPEVTQEHFVESSIEWYGDSTLGVVESPHYLPPIKLAQDTHISNQDGILIAESTSLRNRFAYNKLIGQLYPSACHMGATARTLSLDIVFNNQRGGEGYRKFCIYKTTADTVSKSQERYDRVTGWKISTPISRLLGLGTNLKAPSGGVYVPLSVVVQTGDEPDMLNCRVDLVENNLEVVEQSEIVLTSGGTDYDSLRAFYDLSTTKEKVFRDKLVNNTESAIAELVGGSADNYKSYELFWPIEKGIIKLKTESAFGLLNLDTLRATLIQLDKGGALVSALMESALATGKRIANVRVGALTSLSQNISIALSSLSMANKENPEIAKIYNAVRNIVSSKLVGNGTDSSQNLSQEQIDEYSANLTNGLLGDRAGSILKSNSTTGWVISSLSSSNLPLHPEFLDALFTVIVERKPRRSDLPYIYSMDGVYSAFYKLIYAYTASESAKDEINISDILNTIKSENYNRDKNKTYPDLILPSYTELYGERWTKFAPTFDDLGIDTYGNNDLRKEPAVSPEDIVSPAAWFAIKRTKEELRSAASAAIKGVSDSSPAFSLSVPFNTQEIDRIKELIKTETKARLNSDKKAADAASEAISELIVGVAKRYKASNEQGFRQDLVNMRSSYTSYEDVLRSNKPVRLLIHHNGNYVLSRELNTSVYGAELFRVLGQEKKLENTEFGRIDPGAQYTSSIDNSVKFHRHMKSSNEACVQSSLTQVADDQFSPERMFPAIKVYLLDRRGSDVIADDTLFNVGSIISVDITMDKEDAPLAVIKLADPLYTLQDDYFDKLNVSRIKGTPGSDEESKQESRKVFGTLRDADQEGFIKRYKLVQGRSVQIRMGYSSMAYALPIVFTGKITEIVPGDQLTIVCQGWKAELISRQVNFTSDEPKNYGARDLAIQAITYASPEGFGDFYPEFDTQYILRNLNPDDVQSVISRSMSNREGVDLEGVGSRSTSEAAFNYFQTLLGFASRDKKNKGFDTRLKNIWYPDTEMYSNILGLRTFLNVMPEWMNCGWIVPLQPAWNVLKEASRHAWNCIVEVVPYDGEATIFMGHPDQPYFYTRGNNNLNKAYQRFKKTQDKHVNKAIDELLRKFYESKEYGELAAFPRFTNDGIIDNRLVVDYLKKTNKGLGEIDEELTAYKSLMTWLALGSRDKALRSPLPLSLLNQVKENGASDRLPILLFCHFFGIPESTLINGWATITVDLMSILGRDQTEVTPDLAIKLRDMVGAPEDNSTQGVKDLISDTIEWFNGRYRTSNLLTNFNKESLRDTLGRRIDTEIFPRSDYFLKPDEWYQQLATRRSLTYVLTTVATDMLDRLHQIETVVSSSRNVEDMRSYLLSRLAALKGSVEAVHKEMKKADLVNIQRETFFSFKDKLVTTIDALDSINQEIDKKRPPLPAGLNKLQVPLEKLGHIRPELVEKQLVYFKAFVYYFSLFLLNSQDPEVAKLASKGNLPESSLPPNMRVFRVHHFADDVHNIIQNNIVATTREMWNTVVIEHPAPGTADNDIENESQLYTEGTINSGASWVYWPAQEVTGVIGLQFHPGLVLANKKVQVFTEINCQNPDLAGKLAHERLAEGIKKMYRGNLLLVGKHIKPYDRIILADGYTKMSGPVEVESVTHHWNTSQGWVTNIIPCAVCDANPGSAALQTAAFETAFQRVYNIVEFVSDIWTYATIIATAGAATPLAVGKFSARKGVFNLVKRLFAKNGLRNVVKRTAKSAIGIGGRALSAAGGVFQKGHRLDILRYMIRTFGGPGSSLLLNETIASTLEFGNDFMWKNTVIQGFVEGSNHVEQLPVVLSPLIFNGNAFTAGLESDDAIWAIGAFGTYYSMKEFQAGASRYLADLFAGN